MIENTRNQVATPWLRSSRLLSAFALAIFLLTGLYGLLALTTPLGAAADLTVETISAYNLVVDSNVESPSTYAPSVATVAGRFCNVGDTDLTDVQGYIGDGTTPGAYPVRDSSASSFANEHPHLANTGLYSYTHVGGQLGTGDAARYIGTIPAGECVLQYWHFTYPRRGNPNNSGDAVWGATNVPEDDLWLEYTIWGVATGETGGGANNSTTYKMTMRNEISAMANKIRPNPDGQWFNTNTSIVAPGDVITSNGILYNLGNIRHGFDNDGDFNPDYNAWMQPIGDPSYDPSCFRLIRTSGVLTVSRSAGLPDLIIPFDDQDPTQSEPFGGPLYFSNLPSDNNGVRGKVFYTFMAMNGPCSSGLSPYQEVASGFDNEKFNGDYGVGIPPLGSSSPAVTIDKSSNPDGVALGDIFNYNIPLGNTGSTGVGLYFSTGGGIPLVVSDTIPAGLEYIAGSASFSSSQAGLDVNILYSTDNGATWISTEPVPANTVTNLQWWFDDTFAAGETASATFDAQVPLAYTGSSFIENCANAAMGDGASFAEACTITIVDGPNQLGNFVWRDENNDGVQDAGEAGIDNVTLSLYWDKNGDDLLDDGDIIISSTTTPFTNTGTYLFSSLPDGKYIVVVAEDDPDIPTGYRHTTPTELAVDLDSAGSIPGAVSYGDADFGFGPSLSVNKTLAGGGGLEGNELSYIINVNNLRPGGGVSVTPTSCQYTTWATVEASQSASQSANKRWENSNGAMGAEGPDGLYAVSDYRNTTNQLAGTAYNLSPQSGSITAVEAIFSIYYNGTFSNDEAQGIVFFNGTDLTGGTPQAFTTANLTPFGPGNANQGLLTWDVTALRSWTWTDFTGDLDLEFDTIKQGGVDGVTMFADAIGLRVTSDEACSLDNADDIFNTVPLTDTYNTSLLQFVSAVPPQSSINTTSGVITWTNIGPIYPGQTRGVQVNFLALEPSPEVPTTVNNTTCATGSLFGDGRAVNDDCDTATGTITPTATITGAIWSDLGTLGWVGANGYESGTDLFIANATVNLYRCDNLSASPNFNQSCSGGSNGGTWTLVDSTPSGSNGRYSFDGLDAAFYYVEVVESSIIGNPTSPSGNADADANTSNQCSSGCPTNDSLWQAPGANLGNMIYLNYTTDGDTGTNDSNGDVTHRNFGYDLNPAIIGTVWHDVDGDGTRETGENGLGDGTTFVTVRLDDCGPDTICGNGDDGPTLTTSTNITGEYEFTGLTGGTTYRIRVDDTTLPAGGTWTQTDDPDVSIDDQHTVTVQDGEISGSHDFGYTQTGTATIGDTVYTDWNGDGDIDAGETGMAGVDVILYQDSDGNGSFDATIDAFFGTDTTDANGLYSFSVPGTYTYFVVIDETDLPSTHVQTGDPDETGTCSTCNGRSTVSGVTNGSSHLDEDFGYQPTGFSSIGDFVWQDDDGDGVQDTGESGIPNIQVSLYFDNNNDGIIDAGDALVMTTTTGTNGDYLFNLLPAGDYLVLVDEADTDLPTDGNGDPFVLSSGSNPIDVTLSASEIYLDADFGFTTGGIIGDFIWQDNNGDGNPDIGEPGISSVTVTLYVDVNGDGDYDPGTDTLYGSTTTDANGLYNFSGLPAADYVVVVTPPAGHTATGDPDENSPPACTTCDHESGVTLAAGQIDLSRDFGYQPAGVIGDTVWVDIDGDGVFSPTIDSPLGNITVTLSVGGTPILTTTTDTNGQYSFGGLADNTYVVTIDPTNLPVGLLQTYDPDEGNNCITCDGMGTSTISGGGIDFTEDFGYQFMGPNSVSGTIFHDDNNNAVQDLPTESTTYSAVTVYLWHCGSDNVCGNGDDSYMGSIGSDLNGDYSFGNLPDGRYVVSTNPNAPNLIGTDPTITTSPTTYREVDLDQTGTNPAPVNALNEDFGYLSTLDLGDLPDSYGTSLNNDGARHTVLGSLFLGEVVTPDVDPNGQVDSNAGRVSGGDDGDGNDDEDGVFQVFGNAWGDGSGQIEVDVTGTGCLLGWIDWDDSGTFDAGGTTGGVSELLINQAVSTGNNQQFNITSPTVAEFGGTYNIDMFVRFRLFPPNDARFGNMPLDASGCPTAAGEIGLFNLVTGIAADGEVEDYEWLFNAPTAVSLQEIRAISNTGLPVVFMSLAFLLLATAVIYLFYRRQGYIQGSD